MYKLYTNAMGKDLCENLTCESLDFEYVDDCHMEFCYYSQMIIDRMKESSSQTFVTTDFDFNYLSDYSVTKYFTEDANGKYNFWKYDFNRFFPVCARPSVVIISKDMNNMNCVENAVIEYYSSSRNVKLNHPIVPNNKIVLKMLITNKSHINHYQNEELGIYRAVVFLDTINIPWYFSEWNKNEISNDNWLQKEALRQFFALSELEDNCTKRISESSNDENDHIRLQKMRKCKADLLVNMDISDDMKNINTLRKIEKIVNIEKISIKDAIKKLYLESIENKKKEIEKKNKELQRQQKVQEQYYEDDYYENDYYDDYSDRSSSIIGALFCSVSDYRNERKQERNQREYERERQREQDRREYEERHRRALRSQREWDAVKKANEERRRKGQPELPYPPREWC